MIGSGEKGNSLSAGNVKLINLKGRLGVFFWPPVELYIGLWGFDLIYVGIFKSTEITTWGEINIKVTDDFVILPDNQTTKKFLSF